ncbi:MAG: hypothetical protein HUJ98_03580 [Bacteroidaceae bacterium]|nr:hypothetical protein [Bacteroidaceae bacterium]
MKKCVFLRKISCVLLFTMVIGCFEPWSLKVIASKGEQVVAHDEALINHKDYDLELNLDDNPEDNDPMAEEEPRDSEEFCGDEFTFEELEAMGIDVSEDTDRGNMAGTSTFAAGGSNGYNNIRFGVDVSKWQGDMNWAKAAQNDVEFAFVRACYRGLNDGGLYDDPKVFDNIQGAYDAGISVGLYCFSQAVTVAEAQAEADRLVAFANSRPGRINLPLVMDYEYGAGHSGRLAAAGFNKAQATAIIKAFCERVESQGYEAMVYASLSVLKDDMNAAEIVNSGYDIWVARYTRESYAQGGYTDPWDVLTNTQSLDGVYPGGDFEFWQYSSKGNGKFFGAQSDYIDLDYWFEGMTATLECDLIAKPTIAGKTYDLIEPFGEWYEYVEVDGKKLSPELTKTTTSDANDKHLKLEIHSNSAREMRVKVHNGYPSDLYELVYKLNYDSSSNTYTATLEYINDFIIRLDSWPAGYEEHAVVDKNKTYEMVDYRPWHQYVMAVGAGAKQFVIYKYDENDIKCEKRTYSLTFDNNAHCYSIGTPVVDDYSIVITPPEGYASEHPKIWLDGVARDATKTKDGKWKLKLGYLKKDEKLPEVVSIYSYKQSGAPLGMSSYLVSFDDGYILSEISSLKDVLYYGGYSMKVTGTNGMRYRAGIKNSFKNTLRTTGVDGYKLKEYGIVAITSKNYETLPLVLDGEKTSIVKAFYYVSDNKIKDVILSRDSANDMCYFSAFFEKMPVKAYKTPMVTRSYLKVEKAGKIYTIYSAPYSKDMYQLANQVLAANEFKEGTPENKYIKSIINDADNYREAGQ